VKRQYVALRKHVVTIATTLFNISGSKELKVEQAEKLLDHFGQAQIQALGASSDPALGCRR
jgi:regulator of sigma D